MHMFQIVSVHIRIGKFDNRLILTCQFLKNRVKFQMGKVLLSRKFIEKKIIEKLFDTSMSFQNSVTRCFRIFLLFHSIKFLIRFVTGFCPLSPTTIAFLTVYLIF